MLKYPISIRKWLERFCSNLCPCLKDYNYTIRRGLAKGLKKKSGTEFIPEAIAPLTKEEKFLINLDLTGQIIYDIGGYEGVFTLFFARAAGETGKVITFEPHPENYNKILKNVELNKFDNVEVRQLALGSKKEKKILVFPDDEYGLASLEEKYKSKILKEKRAKSIPVEVDSLDGQLATYDLPKPDFVKIDVEAVEMDVLIGMSKTIKTYKPKLFIEIHTFDKQIRTKHAQNIINFLLSNSYSIYHVEFENEIISSNACDIFYGHLYCS